MKPIDSRGEIGQYVFLSKYSKFNRSTGGKETWQEAVRRVLDMHLAYYSRRLDPKEITYLKNYMTLAGAAYMEKRILGAQRALQYGGELLLEKHPRMYNCAGTYADRVEVFKELTYLLLCGAGTGYSVQRRHVEKLPIAAGFNMSERKKVVIPDTIEGWAEAVDAMMRSFFFGYGVPDYDYSLIRPKGAYIRGGFRAPGHLPLKGALDKIFSVLRGVRGRRLTPFEVHHVMCICANAIVSGGVRRSAMISLFDADDAEMANCKTGNWMETMPELCRCNNSAVILPDTPKEQFDRIFESVKAYGEPGFVFLESPDFILNPCAEVGLFPKYQDDSGEWHSGWGFCNLVEINGGKVKTENDFYLACEAAAIIATLQAGYTDFAPMLTEWSERIARRDALIGVGITGICENPDILLNPDIQSNGAMIVRRTNETLAKLLHISPAARCTVVKPSGNSSQLLGTLSGITPGHSRHYIRHIQANDTEQCLQEFERVNPEAVEPSVWNPTVEKVISFPVMLPENTLIKKNLTAVQFLRDVVLLTKRNWIDCGRNPEHPSTIATPKLSMNVSNTCVVREDEWGDVREFLWENRNNFSGVSLLPATGDLDYPQAPFMEVLSEEELVAEYGSGAILSSGLIVDALEIFSSIWEACEVALGRKQNLLKMTNEEIASFVVENITDGHFIASIDGVSFSDINCVLDYLRNKIAKRKDWIRRFNNFADRYMEGDRVKTSYCLKHVDALHRWCVLSRMRSVDYSSIKWDEPIKEAGSEVATACASGSCEIEFRRK